MDEASRAPFTAIGKPETLRGDLFGYWSSRIAQEQGVILSVKDKVLGIALCRYHY